jgi:thiol-disulfide isomerase/thioredoxin
MIFPLKLVFSYLSLLAFFLFSVNDTIAQNAVEINIKVKNYENDTLIIGNYFGERQVVFDTLYAKKPGVFDLKKQEPLQPGMYMALIKPQNTFIQFMANLNESKFSFEFDAEDLEDVKFKNSKDNNLFYSYVRFIKDLRLNSERIKEQKKMAEQSGEDVSSLDEELKKFDKQVVDFQKDIINNHRGTLTALLLAANKEVEIPEFTVGDEAVLRQKRYEYFKEHYFDNIDMTHPAFLRMPYGFNKLDTYLNKVLVQIPDSVNAGLDLIFQKLEPNEEAFRYYLSYYLNHYSKSKIVGIDGIVVHLIDKYYAKGKAPWVSEENMEKILKSANDLRPLLIGKICPNFTTYTEDGKAVELHKIDSDYTILLFWANDCGHCKKAMPHYVEYMEKNKDKDITFMTVCSKAQDKVKTCWEGVKEKKMEGFINTADEYARWRRLMAVDSTPKMFVMDRDKKILIKDLPAERFAEIMEDVMRIENEKKAKASN